MVQNRQNSESSSGGDSNKNSGDLAARLSRLEARVSKLEGNGAAPQKPKNLSDEQIFEILHS